MIALAFKRAATQGTWSKIIAWRSKSPYSHVEGWISGEAQRAQCFSSREGSGTSFIMLDLTEPKVWDIIYVKDPSAERTLGFCLGMENRSYDYIGLLGFDRHKDWHEPKAVFCSEVWTEWGQKCLGLWPETHRWLVSPGMLWDMLLKETGLINNVVQNQG